jgi:hypothetical protein
LTATYQEITVEQGGTFTITIDVLDSTGLTNRTDLAGWTGEFVIRADRDPSATLLATGTVAVNASTGVATATLDDTATAAMTWRSGQYDIWITNGTDTEPLAWGKATFRRSTIT